MKLYAALLFSLLSLCAPVFAGDQEPIAISVQQDAVLIVPHAKMQTLNFDFLVRNDGKEPLEFESIRMAVFDRNGVFVTAREINSMGMCPSILTLPHAKIEP